MIQANQAELMRFTRVMAENFIGKTH